MIIEERKENGKRKPGKLNHNDLLPIPAVEI